MDPTEEEEQEDFQEFVLWISETMRSQIVRLVRRLCNCYTVYESSRRPRSVLPITAPLPTIEEVPDDAEDEPESQTATKEIAAVNVGRASSSSPAVVQTNRENPTRTAPSYSVVKVSIQLKRGNMMFQYNISDVPTDDTVVRFTPDAVNISCPGSDEDTSFNLLSDDGYVTDSDNESGGDEVESDDELEYEVETDMETLDLSSGEEEEEDEEEVGEKNLGDSDEEENLANDEGEVLEADAGSIAEADEPEESKDDPKSNVGDKGVVAKCQRAPPTLSCLVCMDTSEDIASSGRQWMSIRCGHVYCDECVFNLLMNNSRCPSCRSRFQWKDARPIFF